MHESIPSFRQLLQSVTIAVVSLILGKPSAMMLLVRIQGNAQTRRLKVRRGVATNRSHRFLDTKLENVGMLANGFKTMSVEGPQDSGSNMHGYAVPIVTPFERNRCSPFAQEQAERQRSRGLMQGRSVRLR